MKGNGPTGVQHTPQPRLQPGSSLMPQNKQQAPDSQVGCHTQQQTFFFQSPCIPLLRAQATSQFWAPCHQVNIVRGTVFARPIQHLDDLLHG